MENFICDRHCSDRVWLSSFIHEDLDTWQRDITKYKISRNNKEDCYYYNQISRNEIKKYKIEELSKEKEEKPNKWYILLEVLTALAIFAFGFLFFSIVN